MVNLKFLNIVVLWSILLSAYWNLFLIYFVLCCVVLCCVVLCCVVLCCVVLCCVVVCCVVLCCVVLCCVVLCCVVLCCVVLCVVGNSGRGKKMWVIVCVLGMHLERMEVAYGVVVVGYLGSFIELPL